MKTKQKRENKRTLSGERETDVAKLRAVLPFLTRIIKTTRRAKQPCSFYRFVCASRYLFPSSESRVSWPNRSLRSYPSNLRKFRQNARNCAKTREISRAALFLFFPPRQNARNRVFQRFVHRSSFLQIAAARYPIGNFRNLSRSSDDLLPAHRPFDTASALETVHPCIRHHWDQ